MTDKPEQTGEEPAHGKRAGWVELYCDLVFVFAAGQVAHGIVEDPRWSRVLAALGLFATLWWTWIGFALLYNRRGDDSRAADRLFVLAGTIPCAIAATQAHHAFDGHPAIFATALAGVRLILMIAHRWPSLEASGSPEVSFRTRTLTWADGSVFRFPSHGRTEEHLREYVEAPDIVHWSGAPGN